MNIKHLINDFVSPRFSTEDMEKSTLKCGLTDFKVKSMYYDAELPGFPSHAFGSIRTPEGNKFITYWNKYGECWVDGRRHKSFDLVRASQEEINTGKAICESLIVGLIVICICIIF